MLSHSAKNFRRGSRLCFRKFLVSKNFTPKKGITRFSMEKLLFHSSEKFRRGTLLCFTKFLMSKKITDKRGGEYHEFPLKNLCLTVSIKLRGITLLGFQRTLVSKSFERRRGKLHGFVEKLFISQYRKKFAREPFCVSEKFWYKNVLCIGGRVASRFCRNFYVSQYRRLS